MSNHRAPLLAGASLKGFASGVTARRTAMGAAEAAAATLDVLLLVDRCTTAGGRGGAVPAGRPDGLASVCIDRRTVVLAAGVNRREMLGRSAAGLRPTQVGAPAAGADSRGGGGGSASPGRSWAALPRTPAAGDAIVAADVAGDGDADGARSAGDRLMSCATASA